MSTAISKLYSKEGLTNFIKLNLSNSNLIDSFYRKDKDLIIDILINGKHDSITDGEKFLNQLEDTSIKDKVIRNYLISLERERSRALINEPVTGDIFKDDKGDLYRIVIFHDDLVQFCYSGSFHMSKSGNASMSGGFADVLINGKEVYKVSLSELQPTGNKDKRSFWFFMDNSAGGNRGLYFDCNVNEYQFKQ